MNIDKMPAGRELDALIVEKVMGWISLGKGWWATESDERMTMSIFAPSTDIAAAWQVMLKMLDAHGDRAYIFARELCGGEPVVPDDNIYLEHWDGEDVIFYVLKMLNRLDPLLICRAALKAVME